MNSERRRQALKRARRVNTEQKRSKKLHHVQLLLRRLLLNAGKKEFQRTKQSRAAVQGFSLSGRWRRIKANRVRSRGVVHRVQDEEAGWKVKGKELLTPLTLQLPASGVFFCSSGEVTPQQPPSARQHQESHKIPLGFIPERSRQTASAARLPARSPRRRRAGECSEGQSRISRKRD